MASRKGIPNKNKEFLLNRLKDMFGEDFDPIMMAAKNAIEMNNLAQVDLTQEQMADMDGAALLEYTNEIFSRKKECVTAFDKIAQYVQPKLKAIELSGEVEVSAHEQWLESLIAKAK